MTMSKEGSTIGGLMDTIGILTSFALQYGVPLEALVNKLRYQNFEPRGLVREGHPEIKVATSIVDYIFTYLEKQFLNKEKKNDLTEIAKAQIINGLDNKKKDSNFDEVPGGFCITCASQMIKKGHCMEICPKCGWIDPKGCGE